MMLCTQFQRVPLVGLKICLYPSQNWVISPEKDTLGMIINCPHLKYDWSFPLNHHINYTYYFYFTHFRVFHGRVSWSFSTGKTPYLSWNLLSILADFNNAVVWIDPFVILLNLCTIPLVSVPSMPITIDITDIFVFHSSFSTPTRSWYLYLFFLSFFVLICDLPKHQCLLVHRFSLFIYLFLLTITMSGHLADIIGSVLLLFLLLDSFYIRVSW